MKLGDLFIKLGLKSEQFEQGVDKAKSSVNSFGSIIKTIGPMVAAAFSVAAIVGFFKTAISFANQQIEVENRLGAAIKANGKDVDSTLGRYKRFASEMQRITTIGDETTLSILQLAESMQSKAPEQAAKMAIGFSKALNIDLSTAMRMAVNAQQGNVMMLGRYSSAIRDAKTEAEKMAAVQQLVTSGLAIATAETETAAGKVAQLKNAWGDFKEIIGQVIVENGKLIKTIGDMTLAVEMLSTKKFGVTSFLAFLSGGKSWEADKKRFLETLEMQKKANEAMDEYEANIKGSQTTIVKHTKTLAELRSEITTLKETREALTETDIAGITAINKEITAIEAKIKKLEELGKAVEKVARAENRGVGAIASGTQFSGPFTAREQYSGGFEGTMREVAPIDNTQLADMTAFLQRNAELTKRYTDEMLEDWQNFNSQLALLIEDFGIDVVDKFGSAIGEMIASGSFPSDFGNNILESIGRFVSTLGKMLIALGVGSESFKQLLGSGFLSGGVGAIAAGALLVAAGGAISSYARSRAGGGGSSGGSGMFNQNYNVQLAGASGQSSQASLFLKGDNIYMSQQRNEFKRGVIG